MADEIRWITVNGTHIPTIPGQSKEDTVKAFIENEKRKKTFWKESIDGLSDIDFDIILLAEKYRFKYERRKK